MGRWQNLLVMNCQYTEFFLKKKRNKKKNAVYKKEEKKRCCIYKKRKKKYAVYMYIQRLLLHGPSMFAVKAKIYGVLYKQSSSIAFDETSNYWSAPKTS